MQAATVSVWPHRMVIATTACFAFGLLSSCSQFVDQFVIVQVDNS